MNQYTETIVIGGGLVGAATSYYLAEKGREVTLVERGQLNRQSSGQNAGSLHFQLEYRMIAFWEQLQHELSQLIPLSIASETKWRHLESELGLDLEVVQHGGLMVAETAEEWKVLTKKFELEKKLGLNTELLSSYETHNLAPYLSEKVIGSAFCPEEGHANPRQVTPAFARKAIEKGANVHINSSVRSIEKGSGRWVVELVSGKRVIAENVVITAGAWTQEIGLMLGLHIPVYPVPLLMNVVEKSPPFLHHMVQHVGKRLTMKQVRDGNILVGGGWQSYFQKKKGKICFDLPPLIDPRLVKENVRLASSIVPGVNDLRLIRSWAGVTGITHDQLPLIGELPERKGVYIAVGGSGFTFGPLYGQIISDLITEGESEFDIGSFSPEKLAHLNLFMR
ncbi:NAD(P)/FAD-dependent oxidoreductase [Halalkalibacillus halophilus]|uniref:NAD(P)/FAD-dependent oxidoreductase n=1 Tax=Halalkalibacillus halophilus TaxID=392827 RepID=UPI0003FD4C07|nr:FAD-dependent oxidoreductase [Halalkalibacillus halophilus]